MELKRRGYTPIGPTRRDGAIVIDEIESAADLPLGWKDVQAPGSYRLERRDDDAVFGFVVGPHSFRRWFHVPQERLFQLRRKGRSFEPVPFEPVPFEPVPFEPVPSEPVPNAPDNAAPARKLALIGARACEIAAMDVQDTVLMADPQYAARRSDVLVIAVSCNEPGGTCFCTSMDSGPRPTTGYDLALTELLTGDHRFVVDIGSEAGAEIAAALALDAAPQRDVDSAAALAEEAVRNMGRTLDTEGIKELLYDAAEHPRWEEVAERCLSCTSCTLVCPTCFCSRVDDVTSLDGQTAERVRSWDSCFSLEHSYMHGGPARTSVAARYRQWLTHKLASWIDQFGSSGCVGCGRCVTWCPAGIDITEEVAAIRAEPAPPRSKRI